MSWSEPDVSNLRGHAYPSALGDRLGESATFPAMLGENVETSLCAPTGRSLLRL